jgi:hypothetical protein
MRKWLMAGAGAAAVAAAAVLFVAPSFLRARPGAGQPDEPAARVARLPIGQVVLFSSGVGYFQREGAVEGDARVDLSFPTTDVNDLLKSMVLRDLDGGHVSAVSYDSNAPVERTLKSFAVNLQGNPSFADILHQARGEKAEVALANAGAGALNGTIIGVERQRQQVGKEVLEQQVLNLWCPDGMRSVKLSEVQRVRFLNAGLDSEFKKALETLAQSHDTQKKAVSIRFAGEGRRRVKVGYVVENPIWKTSYRLVLSAKGEGKPYLQGWAVVENPTDEDWKGVRMALVSGRPISFQMELYTTLYVPRPVVVPELFQGLRPVAYSGALDNEEGRRLEAEAARARLEEAERRLNSYQRARAKVRGAITDDDYGAAVATVAKYKAEAEAARYGAGTTRRLQEALDLGKSISSAASAARLGDYFQYAIDRPVTLPRQKSALLPIVGKDVEASRVSIYNERVQAKFPLLGLRFKNTTGLHLMQGPVTVFEGASYAGDAQVQDLQPGEERLVSYAIDLGTEVSPAPAQGGGRVTRLKAVKGVLTTTTRVVESRLYTAKNRSGQGRTLLVEHPVRHDFKLVDGKPAETAADVYRFELKLPAGETKTLTVKEERLIDSSVSISSQSDEQVRVLLREAALGDAMKQGLQKAIELRLAVEKTKREVAELSRQLGAISEDQKRLRANLREMPSTAKAYKRYLEKFDQQETEIERLQADVKKLEATQHTQQKAFDDFLAGFTAE